MAPWALPTVPPASMHGRQGPTARSGRSIQSLGARISRTPSLLRHPILLRPPTSPFFLGELFKFFLTGSGYPASLWVGRTSALPASNFRARIDTALAVQKSRILLSHIRGGRGDLDRSAMATALCAGPSDALRSTGCRGARRLTTHWSGHLCAAAAPARPRVGWQPGAAHQSRQAAQFGR